MDQFSFDTYADYGLSENPFVVHALRPDAKGRRLLVGRDEDLKQVARCLHKHGKITCLDGHVGVGKTSLVNVAAYLCYDAFIKGSTPQLLVPVAEPFQLKKDEDVNAFCADVFRRVAQTLLKYRIDLQGLDQLPREAGHLDAWLNSPIVEHVTGALGIGGSFGFPGVASANATVAGGTNRQLNTSAAFGEQGFEQLIRTWLEQIFSVKGNGGVICVIDNLELLESGVQARRTLEVLRDRLFGVIGLRWVFCGANGVIHSLAGSERLASFLNTPVIDVDHVKTSALEPLFHARFKEFAMVDEADAWARLPLKLSDLQALYPIVNFNLRDLLALADEYCEDIHGKDIILIKEDHKAKRFAKWLERITVTRYQALKSRLPSDAWVILDLVMSDDFRGTFGIGDYESLNQNSRVGIAKSTFEKRLRDLVKNGLVSKSIDDEVHHKTDGFTREVFNVTAKGSLVHYARLVKQENQTIKPLTWLRRVHENPN
jgi:hypothetical protein